MNFPRVILFSAAGVILQILLHVLAFTGSDSLAAAVIRFVYGPWIRLGDFLDRASGSGGHAFSGGAILGWLVGVLVYSLLIGAMLAYLTERYKNKFIQ